MTSSRDAAVRQCSVDHRPAAGRSSTRALCSGYCSTGHSGVVAVEPAVLPAVDPGPQPAVDGELEVGGDVALGQRADADLAGDPDPGRRVGAVEVDPREPHRHRQAVGLSCS